MRHKQIDGLERETNGDDKNNHRNGKGEEKKQTKQCVDRDLSTVHKEIILRVLFGAAG